jgi:hypothetical protein
MNMPRAFRKIGPDPFRGTRTAKCRSCGGNGRTDHGQECDWCGGSGIRRQCLRSECQEFGCGGHGTCKEPPHD